MIKSTTLVLIASMLCSFEGVYASSVKNVTETGITQQKKELKGLVNSDSGPVTGAAVSVKGTTVGTITDINGRYSIVVPEGATLVISFIGYTKQEIKYAGQSTLNVKLIENAQSLDEVVVTALGMKRSYKSLGYAISTIKGTDFLVAGKSANPLTSLYGKAAGVGIQSSSAGPTGGINIKIRGAASLESSSKTRPLFVVDGVPIFDKESSMAERGYDPLNSYDYGSGINDINAEDIESMEILKGAKASVLYGSEGANGVILITTKKGAQTRGLGVTVSFQHTYEQPVSYIDFQNEYGSGVNQYDQTLVKGKDGVDMRGLMNTRYSFGPKFDGKPIMDIDGNVINYEAQPNNFMDFFRGGYSDNANVAIAGGNEQGSMRLSYTNYNYMGLLDNFSQKKNSLSFSGKMNASKFATFEINSNLYSVSTTNRYPNIKSLVSFGVNRDQPFSTLERLYKDDSGYKYNQEGMNLSPFAGNMMNMLWHQRENRNADDKMHFINSMKAKFNFHENVYLVLQGGIDYTNIKYTKEDKVTAIEPKVIGGKYSVTQDQTIIQNYEAILNFDKNFFNDRLNVLAFAGASYRRNEDNSMYVATYGNFQYPDYFSLKNEGSWPSSGEKGKVRGLSRGSDVMYGVYGGATISFDERYYVELTARNDWASTLPAKNNSYFYPGVSFNWNFQDQIRIPELKYGKLRMAWADAGRPATRYFANNVFGLGKIPDTETTVVSTPSSLFANEMIPERKRELEVGTNLRFFKQNRLEVDFSFYTNDVYSQIMSIPVDPSSGWGTMKINAGKVHNTGYELFVKGALLEGKNYRWEVSGNFAQQMSKVIDLSPGVTQKVMGGGKGYKVVANVDRPMGELYTYDYKKDDKGNRIVNSVGQFVLDAAGGFKPNSNVNPSVFGGVNTTFFYKNLTVNLGFDYKFGGTILSMSNYYLLGNGLTKGSLKYRDESHGGMAYYIDAKDKKVAWEHGKAAPADAKLGRVYHDGLILNGVKEDGTPNDVILNAVDYYSTFLHDMGADLQPDQVYKNDYIKFREIGITYTIPKKIVEKFHMQKISLSLTARNLFYLYKTIPNVDAESTLGTNTYEEYSFFPTTRSFGVGITASF